LLNKKLLASGGIILRKNEDIKTSYIAILQNRQELHKSIHYDRSTKYEGYLRTIDDIIFNISSGYSLIKSVNLCIDKYREQIRIEQTEDTSLNYPDEFYKEGQLLLEFQSSLEEALFIKETINFGNFQSLEKYEKKINFITVNINGIESTVECSEKMIDLLNGTRDPAFHVLNIFEINKPND